MLDWIVGFLFDALTELPVHVLAEWTESEPSRRCPTIEAQNKDASVTAAAVDPVEQFREEIADAVRRRLRPDDCDPDRKFDSAAAEAVRRLARCFSGEENEPGLLERTPSVRRLGLQNAETTK